MSAMRAFGGPSPLHSSSAAPSPTPIGSATRPSEYCSASKLVAASAEVVAANDRSSRTEVPSTPAAPDLAADHSLGSPRGEPPDAIQWTQTACILRQRKAASERCQRRRPSMHRSSGGAAGAVERLPASSRVLAASRRKFLRLIRACRRAAGRARWQRRLCRASESSSVLMTTPVAPHAVARCPADGPARTPTRLAPWAAPSPMTSACGPSTSPSSAGRRRASSGCCLVIVDGVARQASQS